MMHPPDIAPNEDRVPDMDGAVDYLERFRDSVARRGAHVAVEAPEGIFSYDALDRLSNQLANRLVELGVGPDRRVGISLRRGLGELVALLATTKAGGAYVPLDPSHPPDRLRDIITDAEPQVMVVNAESPFATQSNVQVLALDDVVRQLVGFSETAPPVTFGPDNLAYILFTSGSTGRPKGVEIGRRAFANFITSMAHTPGMTQSDRLLAITTTSFDIAGLELFLPLCVGATVVIADKETTRDPRILRRRLESENISVMQATPATWRLLIEAGWSGDRKLRMLCGGEALSPSLADRLLAAGGELWNVYGPTETTVWSSLERIKPGYDRITIGEPIDETQMYILDETFKPVPVGQEGEIWIGGVGLARGYRGRPDLTSERFVENPHLPDAGRIYRTGDLGRQRADGRFECLGRLDHQVKIRGFRIELGEIESVLRSVPGVAEVLVAADQRADGDPRLVAYWVGEASRESLIEVAGRKLPAYMVPAAYVSLPVFPLNTNGKIDRKHLPAPEAFQAESTSSLRPRTDSETRIAALWGEILGIAQVPIDQSFFTLGGTSPLAVQVIRRIEEDLKIELPLQVFFDSPTVEGIASRVGESFSPDDPIVVWLNRGAAGRAPLFCLFGVNIYQELAFAMGTGRSVIGMHLPFRFVPGRDRRPTLAEVGRRYVELIRRYQEHGPYHLLGLCFGGIVAYEVAAQLEALGEIASDVTVIDAVLPNGVRIDQVKRMKSYVKRALRDPKAIQRRLTTIAQRVGARGLGTQSPGTHAREEPRPIDLPVDGPEVETEVNLFASRSKRLSTRLLVIRATQEPIPAWMEVSFDQGWTGRASEVIVRDIAANHLGVLREPHVRSLANAVADLSRLESQ